MGVDRMVAGARARQRQTKFASASLRPRPPTITSRDPAARGGNPFDMGFCRRDRARVGARLEMSSHAGGRRPHIAQKNQDPRT